MPDPLIWFRLECDTHSNPKVAALIWESRDGAIAAHLWLACLEYSVKWWRNGNLTKTEVLAAFPGVTMKHVTLLVNKGFLKRMANGVYVINDYAAFQAMAESMAALSEKRRAASKVRWDKYYRDRVVVLRADPDAPDPDE
jgi:hypothetical protein